MGSLDETKETAHVRYRGTNPPGLVSLPGRFPSARRAEC